VEHKSHTISIGQSTHQDLVRNPACGAFCLISLFCGTCFSWKIFFLIVLGCIWFEVSYSVYQFIGGEIDSREAFKRSSSVDIIWVTRRGCGSGEQTTWIKQSLLQRYVCVGCQLNIDQALRLLCLKGHVRARGSLLWRYRWQKASEFLCAKMTLLEGAEQPKNRQQNLEMLSPTRCSCHVFKISRQTPQKKTLRVFWNHALF